MSHIQDYQQFAYEARALAVPKLTAEQRWHLEVLAGCPDGCSEELIAARGFTRGVIAELILAGFASAQRKRKVRRFQITEQGRQALRWGVAP